MLKRTFVSLALLYRGCPVINYGGSLQGISPEGFDCSGFVNFLLRHAGYPENIPRTARGMFDSFGILVHPGCHDTGDLVFFSYRGGGGTYPSHVGVMISKEEYIHAPGGNGRVICVSRIKFRTIVSKSKKRQIYTHNPIGFRRITIADGEYRQAFLCDL